MFIEHRLGAPQALLFRSFAAIALGLTVLVAPAAFARDPLGDEILMMTAIDSISNDMTLGVGLVLMLLMQIGAAVLCFMNQRRIRPSLIRKYSNLAVSLMVASMLMPVVPVWGKVIYDLFQF